MIEVCLAFIASIALLHAGIIIALWTGSAKRHNQGMVIGVVGVVLVTITGVVGIVELSGQTGPFFPDLYANITGSADAIYRQPTVIPADNGSVFVAWYSNAGIHYTSAQSRNDRYGPVYIAKLDSAG
jgi:hypothetical protein